MNNDKIEVLSNVSQSSLDQSAINNRFNSAFEIQDRVVAGLLDHLQQIEKDKSVESNIITYKFVSYTRFCS